MLSADPRKNFSFFLCGDIKKYDFTGKECHDSQANQESELKLCFKGLKGLF